MIFPIARKLASALVFAGAAFMAMAAAPVQASEDAAVNSASGAGDSEFRKLFADWQRLDSPVGTTVISKVSVPSRMPVEHVTLTSDFGMRTHPVLGGRRAHKGVDLAGPTGTPVYATADGTVGMAQWFSSYGNYVQIEHGAGLETRYGHLSGYTVEAGQKVHKGDLIGYIGSTGRSTGPHLHYEVRVDGEAVNPIPYMVETSGQQAFAIALGKGGQGGPE